MANKRFRLSKEEVDLLSQFRAKPLDNINGNTALNLHIKERGISKDDIVSVKHWQSASGEYRFSIVTKNNIDREKIFDGVQNLIKDYAPTYPEIEYKKGKCLLVINKNKKISRNEICQATGKKYKHCCGAL